MAEIYLQTNSDKFQVFPKIQIDFFFLYDTFCSGPEKNHDCTFFPKNFHSQRYSLSFISIRKEHKEGLIVRIYRNDESHSFYLNEKIIVGSRKYSWAQKPRGFMYGVSSQKRTIIESHMVEGTFLADLGEWETVKGEREALAKMGVEIRCRCLYIYIYGGRVW